MCDLTAAGRSGSVGGIAVTGASALAFVVGAIAVGALALAVAIAARGGVITHGLIALFAL